MDTGAQQAQMFAPANQNVCATVAIQCVAPFVHKNVIKQILLVSMHKHDIF